MYNIIFKLFSRYVILVLDKVVNRLLKGLRVVFFWCSDFFLKWIKYGNKMV